jgi:hypothetical protein
MNRTSTIAGLLPIRARSATQNPTINGAVTPTGAANGVTGHAHASLDLNFDDHKPLQVQLRRSSQEKIIIAILSSSGKFVALFSTHKFWIYDLGVYASTSAQEDYGLQYPSSLIPITVGRFVNKGGRCDYCHGPRNKHHSVAKEIKISQAALSDEFIAICSTNKTVLIFRRPGPCVHSISLAGESVHQILFSPTGTHLMFLSTYGVRRHRAIALLTANFSRDTSSTNPTHITIPSRNHQPIQPIGAWESSYLPQHATFSADGRKLVIGTAHQADGNCEIRLFHLSAPGVWQSEGHCTIQLVDNVSREKLRLTGIQL